MKALLPSRVHHNSSCLTSSSCAGSRRLIMPVRAKLAKPTTTKGTNTIGAKKQQLQQQLQQQLAKQEQQQKRTLAASKTTRGLSSSQQSSEQAGTGRSSRRGSRFYFNFTGFPFPLGPFFERKTVRTEVRVFLLPSVVGSPSCFWVWGLTLILFII